MTDVIGLQVPPIVSIPPYVSSAGQEAIELAATAGLVLDPWQEYLLRHGLGERADGSWAAFECGVVVSRQNGKGAVFEARCLAGLFLFSERLILYSAHEFKTAQEMFLRMQQLVENYDVFRRRVRRVRTSHGDEGIELTTGQRLRFVARSTGSGRGFSGDVNIMDEAFNLPASAIDALMPTMSARPNPQMWYGSSAGDKTIAPCEHLARVRRRGLQGGAQRLFYAEWSIDPHTQECPRDDTTGAITCTEHDDPGAVESWARANPALGIRISVEHVELEYASMGAKGFGRERLGVGDWPADTADQWKVIPEATWRAVADGDSEAAGRVAFSVHMSRDRQWATICAAGQRPDGLLHGEVIDYRPGTAWLPGRAEELQQRWDPWGWVVDAGSPAGSVIAALEDVTVTDPATGDVTRLHIVQPAVREVGHAYGQLTDAVMPKEGEPTVRIMPHPALDTAVAGAATRRLGNALAWDALAASVDICPLIAMTQALWGFVTRCGVEEKQSEPFAFW